MKLYNKFKEAAFVVKYMNYLSFVLFIIKKASSWKTYLEECHQIFILKMLLLALGVAPA